MITGCWIISCALPCVTLAILYRILSTLRLPYSVFSMLLSFDSKNTFRSILTLAAFRDQLKNSLSKVIIAMASAGSVMRIKALKTAIRSKPTKYSVACWCAGRNVETPSSNISKMHEPRFSQNFECSSINARKLRLCGLWIEINILHYLGWHFHGQPYVVLFIPALM